jgi:hypothetical protein
MVEENAGIDGRPQPAVACHQYQHQQKKPVEIRRL